MYSTEGLAEVHAGRDANIQALQILRISEVRAAAGSGRSESEVETTAEDYFSLEDRDTTEMSDSS